MIDRLEIIGHNSTWPDAERIIFCDGTGGGNFRPETDLELSHWRPNKTPAKYRAGTSTEICFRFLDNPRPGPWTVAVNNHVDVDGILSVFVLVHSQHALAHRPTIIEAAEVGDFWGWGEAPAQRVFQGVTGLMNSGEGQVVYDETFRRIPALIDGMGSYDIDNPRLLAAFEALQRQETAPGRWGLGGTQLPFGGELQNRFPLVGRCLDDQGTQAISQLLPEIVATTLKGAFD